MKCKRCDADLNEDAGLFCGECHGGLCEKENPINEIYRKIEKSLDAIDNCLDSVRWENDSEARHDSCDAACEELNEARYQLDEIINAILGNEN